MSPNSPPPHKNTPKWTIPVTNPLTQSPHYKNAHILLNYIFNYHDEIQKGGSKSSLPVLSQVKPRDTFRAIADTPPEKAMPFQEILNAFDQKILPGITHWQSPHFFAYFCANFSYPALFGDMLASMVNVIGFSWICSPACTELEEKVMDWLASMLQLPEFYTGNGMIQGTASESTLVALIAARQRAKNAHPELLLKEGGIPSVPIRCIDSSKLCVYTSDQAHSSVTKACMILDIPNVRLIKSNADQDFAMDTGKLEEAIQEDLKNGLTPIMCVATCGTTSSLGVDNLEQIGPICEKYSVWLHVDAAFLGAACICPEYRTAYLKGIEHTDSFVFNPHKWLLTNFDCSCFWIKNRSEASDALSITPEYLRNKQTDENSVVDYRDLQIPLGRKMRSLKLYFVICAYGVEGLQKHIRRHVQLAETFAEWMRQDSRFELWPNPKASLLCFHLTGEADSQKILKQLMERLNESGKLFLTHTVLNGRMVLRLSINATFLTNQALLKEAWKTIQQETDSLLKESMTK